MKLVQFGKREFPYCNFGETRDVVQEPAVRGVHYCIVLLYSTNSPIISGNNKDKAEGTGDAGQTRNRRGKYPVPVYLRRRKK